MKRITFKAESVGPILDGSKTATVGWRDQKWEVGEVRAAVTGRNCRPAFSTTAVEAFAILECVSATSRPWGSFTESDAALCGVTRDWYRHARPSPDDMDLIHTYQFRTWGDQSDGQ